MAIDFGLYKVHKFHCFCLPCRRAA